MRAVHYLDGKPDTPLSGKIWGLFQDANTNSLTYRKDLFEKYGVSLPKTYEEVKEVAKQLTLDTDGDGKIDLYGTCFWGTKEMLAWALWSPLWAQFGYPEIGKEQPYGAGGIFDMEWRPLPPDHWEWAFQYYKDLLPYCPPGQLLAGEDQCIAWLQQGVVAFDQGSSFSALYHRPEHCKFWKDMVTTQLPLGDAGIGPNGFRYGYQRYGSGLFINKFSKHKDAAFRFIAYVHHPVNRYIWTLGYPGTTEVTGTGQPTHPGWYDEKVFEYRKDYEALRTNLQWAVPSVSIPESGAIFLTVGTICSRVLAGEIDAKTGGKQCYDELYKIMEKGGYYK
jgi:multiple sugar transport system substrate-binding protein